MEEENKTMQKIKIESKPIEWNKVDAVAQTFSKCYKKNTRIHHSERANWCSFGLLMLKLSKQKQQQKTNE